MGVAAGLVVGVFARWVVGVWCVRLGCLRFLVLALGWVRVVRFALAALPWRLLGAHVPRVGGFGVCAVACAGLGGKVGRDDHVPPLQCGCAPDACAWKRGGAHGVVNTPLSCDRLHGNG